MIIPERTELTKADILHAFAAFLRLSVAQRYYVLALAGEGGPAVLAWRVKED